MVTRICMNVQDSYHTRNIRIACFPVCCSCPLLMLSDSVDWRCKFGEVRVAGDMPDFDMAMPDNVPARAALTPWLLRTFGQEAMGSLRMRRFLRCSVRGMFLRARLYGNDEKRVDYCVRVRSHAIAAPAAGAADDAAALMPAAGAVPPPRDAADVEADVHRAALGPAAAAAPNVNFAAAADADLPGDWFGLVDQFLLIETHVQGEAAALERMELVALVQPLVVIPHIYTTAAVQLPAGWEQVTEWMQNGALLQHMVATSQEQSAPQALRVVPVANISAKRCLLSSKGSDRMLIVRMQNFVEEL